MIHKFLAYKYLYLSFYLDRDPITSSQLSLELVNKWHTSPSPLSCDFYINLQIWNTLIEFTICLGKRV